MKRPKCAVCENNRAKRKCQIYQGKFICPSCCADLRNKECAECRHYRAATQCQASKSQKQVRKDFIMEINEKVENAVDKALELLERALLSPACHGKSGRCGIDFQCFDLESLGVEALLFQTGYLTIKRWNDPLWHLGYPNLEVKCAFLKHLFYSFTHGLAGDEQSRFMLLSVYLQSGDLDAFFETVNAIFASIPYKLEGEPNEAWFHILLYLMVVASGFDFRKRCVSRWRVETVPEQRPGPAAADVQFATDTH